MSEAHVIARCTWHTQFDEAKKSTALQDFISQWSQTVLMREMEQVLSSHCPHGQTWRIDQLTLELGTIDLEDAPRELPQRLGATLQQALERLLAQRGHEVLPGEGGHLVVHDRQESELSLIAWFLTHGRLPWWYQGSDDPLHLIDQSMQEQPQALAQLLRRHGGNEQLRLRIVRQFGVARLRRLIHVQAPWHADWICGYADQIMQIQKTENVPDATPSQYQELTWQFILTYLLIDRGSLFNTANFIRAHLGLLAQHYRIAYAQLLHHVLAALHGFEKKGYGSVDLRLIAALRVLERERPNLAVPAEAPEDEAEHLWPHMQIMLHTGARRRTLERDSVHVEQLFLHLAGKDAPRLAELLRREGKSDSVRAATLRNFSEAALYQLVPVIEPQEHAFIISHIDHVKALSVLAQGRHVDKKMVWQVVLAYLMVERGSYFQRRQMVSNTLQSLCERNQLDYANVLNLLMHAVPAEHVSTQRFALLVILRDLHRQWQGKTGRRTNLPSPPIGALYALPSQADAAWQKLAGLSSPSSRQGQATVRSPAVQGMMAAQLLGTTALLPDLLRCRAARALTSVQLSQAVLDWIGLGRLPRLARLLDPDIAEFSLPLLHALTTWQVRGYLPCFAGLDITRVLAVAMLDALPRFRALARSVDTAHAAVHEADTPRKGAPNKPSAQALMAFWRHFVGVLHGEFGIVRTQLIAQLARCLEAEAEAGALHRIDYPARPGQAGDATDSAGRTLAEMTACVSAMPEMSSRYLTILDIMLGDAGQEEADVYAGEKGYPDNPSTSPQPASDGAGSSPLARIEAYLTGGPRRPYDRRQFEQAWQQLGPGGASALERHVEQSSDKSRLLWALGQHAQMPMVAVWWRAIAPHTPQPAEETICRLRAWLRAADAWHGAEAVLERHIQREFWSLAFDLRAQPSSAAFFLSRLLLRLCTRLPLSLSNVVQYGRRTQESAQTELLHDMLSECEQLGPRLTAAQVEAVAMRLPAPAVPAATSPDAPVADMVLPGAIAWRQDSAGEYLWHPRMADLLRDVLRNGAMPAWSSQFITQQGPTATALTARVDLSRLVQDASVMRPDLFYAVLRSVRGEARAIERVQLMLPFHCLLHAMRASHAAVQANIGLLENWYQCLEEVYARPDQSPRFDAQDLCHSLMQLVLHAWLKQDWYALHLPRLVAAFAWSVIRELGVSQVTLQAVLAPHVYRMPTPLRQAWQEFFAQQRRQQTAGKRDRTTLSSPAQSIASGSADAVAAAATGRPSNVHTAGTADQTDFMARNQALRKQLLVEMKKNTQRHEIQSIPMLVGNAGMVIVQQYLARLMQLLGLTEDGKFVSRHAQHCAVHALQYLVTGEVHTQEHHLVLNKLLCGLPLSEAVPFSWEMSPEQKEICDGLLDALLKYWTESGSHSAEGFRGAWLVRTGSLCETGDHWSLIIDRRSYDVLMGGIPFSYSVIKFPWMNKALYVTWPA
ncbi:hypothetical protein RB25_06950 [Herbaspirillum rubrisubalbicans]|uniref:DUF4132 domain-containing protein n=1 Tax=Herbaspirillum rubrisubalbicans TaxID=80842 RepID=A0ABX9C869_9BURK|nr:contractile injection system tape measure protein [Herbaspirillum rubrisubalbicans]RAM67138.1 hypothetical protein RB24_02200 [Herbaspirillum rubrisubalbicans]RAN48997.1 hypothetical protein RB25_06950 [Herbaspirillum rubrisubalbicans]